MSKNLKTYFIVLLAFVGIVIAWNSLSQFAFGFGVNFVAILGLLTYLFVLQLKDKNVENRTKELWITACSFATVEFLVYCFFEFSKCAKLLNVITVIQSVVSLIAILFFIYVVFRLTLEIKEKRIKFIEIMLGNEKRIPKIKKAKEISNGCLEDKPNNANEFENFTIDDIEYNNEENKTESKDEE